MRSWAWGFWVGAALLGLAGVWVLYRALLSDRSRGRPRCPKCWYDMAGVPGLTCPECGRIARSERRLFATRRRWWRASAAVLVLVLAAALGSAPHVMRTGVVNSLPTWVLITAMWAGDTETHDLLRIVSQRLDIATAPPPAWQRWMLARHALWLIRDAPTASLPPVLTPSSTRTAALTTYRALRAASSTSARTASGSIYWAGAAPMTLDLGRTLYERAGDQRDSLVADLEGVLLRSTDAARRRAAAECLAGLPRRNKSTHAAFLTAFEQEHDDSLRVYLFHEITFAQIDAEKTVPVLARILRSECERRRSGFGTPDQDEMVRTCLRTLREYGTAAAPAAPEAAQAAVMSPYFSLGVEALVAMGQDAAASVCAVAGTAGATQQALLMQAIGGLGEAGGPYQACVRQCLQSSPQSDVRHWAAWALGQMRSIDRESIDLLEKTLRTDPLMDVRMTAYRALCYTAGEARATEVACESVAHEEATFRSDAVVILRRWGFTIPECLKDAPAGAPTSTR